MPKHKMRYFVTNKKFSSIFHLTYVGIIGGGRPPPPARPGGGGGPRPGGTDGADLGGWGG